MNSDVRKTYSFDDVLLVPKFSDVKSRSEVSLASEMSDKITLKLPVVSSPMDTVTEQTMAVTMSKAGGLGIVHRYNTVEQPSFAHQHTPKNVFAPLICVKKLRTLLIFD